MAQKVIDMDKDIDALDHSIEETVAPACAPAAYGRI